MTDPADSIRGRGRRRLLQMQPSEMPGSGECRALRVLVVTGLLTMPACGGPVDTGQDPLQGATSISTLPPTVGPANCQPPSPTAAVAGGTEVRGAGAGGFTAYALFEDGFPPTASTDLEVWWRVSGDHDLKLTLVDGDGREVKIGSVYPDPSRRGWTREGDPWHSTIRFPQTGCWRIVVERGTGRNADLWVNVS